MITTMLILFVVGYAFIAFEHKTGINKSAIALLMCGTLWWPWGAVLLLSGTGIPVRMVSSVNKRQFRPALPAASFQILLFAVVLAVAVAL